MLVWKNCTSGKGGDRFWALVRELWMEKDRLQRCYHIIWLSRAARSLWFTKPNVKLKCQGNVSNPKEQPELIWHNLLQGLYSIWASLVPTNAHHEAGQFWWWWESPEYLSGQDFIVSSKRWGGGSVQAPNWKATVAFNMIGPCCESYHKLNFCFLLHWWSLDKGWACYLGVQVCWEITWRCWSCWGCNMEIPVLLGISLETGPS